jgi:enolase-phosphatase E1
VINFQGIKAVVLDIEGTTCPVDFVTGTLFPYARAALPQYLEHQGNTAELSDVMAAIWQEWSQEAHPSAPSLPPPEARNPAASVNYLQWLIEQDRKSTPLKDLQGKIWQEGYANGALKAPLFDDVAPALQRWHAAGLLLAVYSSGSVAAQQLLYCHSNAGDLRPLFSGWFDTHLGPKRESQSYGRLASALATPAQALLFISDSEAELEAASAAGLEVCGSERAGNPESLGASWPKLNNFSQLAINSPAA